MHHLLGNDDVARVTFEAAAGYKTTLKGGRTIEGATRPRPPSPA